MCWRDCDWNFVIASDSNHKNRPIVDEESITKLVHIPSLSSWPLLFYISVVLALISPSPYCSQLASDWLLAVEAVLLLL